MTIKLCEIVKAPLKHTYRETSQHKHFLQKSCSELAPTVTTTYTGDFWSSASVGKHYTLASTREQLTEAMLEKQTDIHKILQEMTEHRPPGRMAHSIEARLYSHLG